MASEPYERFLGDEPKPKRFGNVASRLTMFVVALAIFYAAYKCFIFGHHVQAEWLKRPHLIGPSSRNPGPGLLLYYLAFGLLGLGGLFLAGAIVNVARLSSWFAPPRATMWAPLVGDTRRRSYHIPRRK